MFSRKTASIFLCKEVKSVFVLQAKLGWCVRFIDYSTIVQKATLAHLEIIFIAKCLQYLVKLGRWLHPYTHYFIASVHFDIYHNFLFFLVLMIAFHFYIIRDS